MWIHLTLFLYSSSSVLWQNCIYLTLFVLTQLLFLSDDLKARLSAIQFPFNDDFFFICYFIAALCRALFSSFFYIHVFPCWNAFCLTNWPRNLFCLLPNKSVSFHLHCIYLNILRLVSVSPVYSQLDQNCSTICLQSGEMKKKMIETEKSIIEVENRKKKSSVPFL